jgi:hypothetical protein
MVRKDDVRELEQEPDTSGPDHELRLRFERLVSEFVGRIEGA